MKSPALILSGLALAAVGGAWRSHSGATGAPPGAPAPPAVTRFPPVPSPTSIRKFDEYGNLRWSDERARLDNFAVELGSLPEDVGYLVGYAGRLARAGEARRRLTRAKNYLVSVRKVEPGSVVLIDGGHREVPTVELYILPRRASPSHLAAPTVDPSEVRIIGSRAKRGRPAR